MKIGNEQLTELIGNVWHSGIPGSHNGEQTRKVFLFISLGESDAEDISD